MSEFNDLSFQRLLELLAEKLANHLSQDRHHLSPRLLTIEQAAAYLGRTRDATQHLVSSGKLPIVRSDRRIFLDRTDLDRWVEEHKQRN